MSSFIRKWLKEIEEGHSTCIINEPDNGLFSPRSPFARLTESPGAQIFGRSFQTQQQSPESLHLRVPFKEVVNPRQPTHEYERKPRHRTKEDRYEYKGHDRRAKPERPSKKKKKTARQSRKHTMNHDFHAPNVSQTRLTLASRLNMGIFGRGRASSPIKSRELPDLTFSEVNFLSRRSRLNHEEPPAEDQQDRMNDAVRRVYDSQLQIPQYFSNDYPEQASTVEETVYHHSEQDAGQPESSAMAATRAMQSHLMEPTAPNPGEISSRPATPYTWSESECRDHERRVSSENCTKGILCTDLDHKHTSDEERANKRYWDFDELKLILKIRQQIWNKSRASKEPETCDHSKRERQPDEAEERPDSPLKKVKLESNDIASVRERLSSPASSRMERDSPSYGHPEPGTYTPERPANRELETTPKGVGFSDYHPMNQSYNPVIAPHVHPPSNWNIDDSGPSDEIDLNAEFDSVIVRLCSKEIEYDKDEDVNMKDFDAVYDSIVDSDDRDPTYTRVSRVSSNQSYDISVAGRSTPLLGNIDEGWNSSLPFGATGQSSGNESHNITSQDKGAPVTSNPLLYAWNGLSQPIASAVDMGTAAVGASTGFCWRQNRLY